MYRVSIADLQIAAFIEDPNKQMDSNDIRKYLMNHQNAEIIDSDSLENGKIYVSHLDDNEVFRILKDYNMPTNILNITGGGVFKYKKELKEASKVNIAQVDEMTATTNGQCFLIKECQGIEYFSYSHKKGKQIASQNQRELFPKLIVNIGSGK